MNTSLTQGLATKANQSALDALQVEVSGKSTPASVDLKLANHPTTAAMNSSIASANNATLATVATTYALKSVVDQLAIDLTARQTAADVDQRVATALLSYVAQAAFDAALALRDGRLDGHDADILALQSAGPFALPSEITALQSAIDSILAEIATLGGATNLVNAPAWPGNITWDLLAGTNTVRNLHATGPLSIALANDNWTLSFACDSYSRGETDALLAPLASEAWVSNEILAALAAYSTTAQVGTAISDALGAYSSTNTAIADAVDALNVGQYQDAAEVQFLIDQALLAYWTQAEVSSFVAGELANYATSASVSSSISSALSSYDDSSQVDSKIITALLDFYTRAEVDQAIVDATSGSVDFVELLHQLRDTELRGQRAAGVLPPNRVGFSSHSYANAILDQRAHPDRDRRRHRRRRLPDPGGCGPALLHARSGHGERQHLQPGPGAVHATHRAEAWVTGAILHHSQEVSTKLRPFIVTGRRRRRVGLQRGREKAL